MKIGDYEYTVSYGHLRRRPAGSTPVVIYAHEETTVAAYPDEEQLPSVEELGALLRLAGYCVVVSWPEDSSE